MIHEVSAKLSWGDLWSVLEAADTFDAILNVGRPTKDFPLPGIEYKLKWFEDHDPYPCADIWECVLWIDAKISDGKSVYVHCEQGNSRSVSTIIAYLHYKGMSFKDACDLAVKIKPYYSGAGKFGDLPLSIRPWFERDWPSYLEEKLQ
jgi:protein-tyrosine phosphatase|tara:strand:- start:2126 stop:2569 length:444 start_codon:yes stop_codon:yes gene_type:complete